MKILESFFKLIVLIVLIFCMLYFFPTLQSPLSRDELKLRIGHASHLLLESCGIKPDRIENNIEFSTRGLGSSIGGWRTKTNESSVILQGGLSDTYIYISQHKGLESCNPPTVMPVAGIPEFIYSNDNVPKELNYPNEKGVPMRSKTGFYLDDFASIVIYVLSFVLLIILWTVWVVKIKTFKQNNE